MTWGPQVGIGPGNSSVCASGDIVIGACGSGGERDCWATKDFHGPERGKYNSTVSCEAVRPDLLTSSTATWHYSGNNKVNECPTEGLLTGTNLSGEHNDVYGSRNGAKCFPTVPNLWETGGEPSWDHEEPVQGDVHNIHPMPLQQVPSHPNAATFGDSNWHLVRCADGYIPTGLCNAGNGEDDCRHENGSIQGGWMHLKCGKPRQTKAELIDTMSVNMMNNPSKMIVGGNNGSCSCDNFCAKDWSDEMHKLGWKGATAVKAVNIQGQSVSTSKTDPHPLSCTCERDDSNPFVTAGNNCMDMNPTAHARITVSGNNGSCSCDKFCAKDWSGEMLKLGWKGASAFRAINSKGQSVSTNKTDPHPLQCICERNDARPFQYGFGNYCNS
jgi:hypothetical protein